MYIYMYIYMGTVTTTHKRVLHSITRLHSFFHDLLA